MLELSIAIWRADPLVIRLCVAFRNRNMVLTNLDIIRCPHVIHHPSCCRIPWKTQDKMISTEWQLSTIDHDRWWEDKWSRPIIRPRKPDSNQSTQKSRYRYILSLIRLPERSFHTHAQTPSRSQFVRNVPSALVHTVHGNQPVLCPAHRTQKLTEFRVRGVDLLVPGLETQHTV